MAISCRTVASEQKSGGSLIGGGGIITTTITTTDVIHADEWPMLATFGGIQLETTTGTVGPGPGWPDNNQQLQAWLAHPSIIQATSIPTVGTVHALESEPTGVQVKDTPPALMTKPGVVATSIPAGSTFTIYWYHNLSGTVQQQDYIAMLVALKTSPNPIRNSFGLGIPNVPEGVVKPAPAVAPTPPTFLTSLSGTLPGSFRTINLADLLIGVYAWAGTSSVTLNSGWTQLQTTAWGSLNGMIFGREILDSGSRPDYTVTATWPSSVTASLAAYCLVQDFGSSGLHVWHPV